MHQLGLFDDGNLRLQRVRRVLLESLDLESALEELTDLLRQGPNAEAERLAATVADLEEALAARTSRDGDLVAALLGLADEVPDWLRAGWHRRLTLEAEQRDGIGCGLGAETAGWHFLQAGDLKEAERSLRATVRRAPSDARSRAHLADVLHRRGQSAPARLEYGRALVDCPDAIDWEAMADREIAALPSIATSEHQVSDPAPGWAAALGLVEGLLPWPAPRLPGVYDRSPTPPAHTGLEFHRLLCLERQARSLHERAALRRQMKALCPSLLAAYLERQR
jgi:tetratricopeptide (TPR) repeat protein